MILSGGRGKRLRPVTDTIPNPLIKINGKPLIEWKINYLKKFGIKDIIICSGYKGNKIKNYIKKKKNFGCNIEYSVETSPLGTGGAIKKAIKNIVDDSFIVLNGDIITNINLKKMMVKTNSIAAIELRTNYGTMKIKNNKIENVKKFINVKLYGAKLSIVIAPSRKGAINITKNLLLSKAIKLKSLLLIN